MKASSFVIMEYHTIHMAGSVVNYAEGTLNNFANEVTYHIKMQ